MKTEYIPIVTGLIGAIGAIIVAIINSNAKKNSAGSETGSRNQTWMIIFAVLFLASLGYIFLGGGTGADTTDISQVSDTTNAIPEKKSPKKDSTAPVKKAKPQSAQISPSRKEEKAKPNESPQKETIR